MWTVRQLSADRFEKSLLINLFRYRTRISASCICISVGLGHVKPGTLLLALCFLGPVDAYHIGFRAWESHLVQVSSEFCVTRGIFTEVLSSKLRNPRRAICACTHSQNSPSLCITRCNSIPYTPKPSQNPRQACLANATNKLSECPASSISSNPCLCTAPDAEAPGLGFRD